MRVPSVQGIMKCCEGLGRTELLENAVLEEGPCREGFSHPGLVRAEYPVFEEP